MFTFKKLSIDKSQIIHVGVSCGKDSIAMSHYLAVRGYKIVIHYVNHGTEHSQRARNSFIEYARHLSDTYRNIFYVVHGAPKEKLTSEKDFRNWRYSVFDDLFSKGRREKLVICHHLGDAVETYLMNCLCGKAHTIPETTDRGNYDVIRPFLLTDPDKISQYLEKYDLEKWVCEDESNKDQKFRRNWVRHTLIPTIEEEYKGLKKVVRKNILTSSRNTV